MREFTGYQEPLSERALTMIKYLPQNVFDNPVYWIIPVAILLILFIRK
jgi:sugar phosphate permease